MKNALEHHVTPEDEQSPSSTAMVAAISEGFICGTKTYSSTGLAFQNKVNITT